MAKVIINDVEFDGQNGERLIDVSRRNAAHIGFLCNGLGICQTCVCQVSKGGDQLTEPTDIEKNWLLTSRLNAGHRMACQARLNGPGTIQIMSRAEELRRQTMDIFTPPDGTTPWENFGKLMSNVGRLIENQLFRFPLNVAGAFPIALKVRINTESIKTVVSDGNRVIADMLGRQSKTT